MSERNLPFVVGLTGGIGSGKSAVTNLFERHGISVVDADVVAREVVMPGQPALQEIRQHFGDEVITTNGELDRAALRKVVFGQPDATAWLNACLHPRIRQSMLDGIAQARSDYCILAVPLLLENGLNNMVQRVLVVDCEVAQQRQRAMTRDGSSLEVINNIIAAQISREKRLAGADDVIDNSTSLEALAPQVEKLHQFYLKLARNHTETD